VFENPLTELDYQHFEHYDNIFRINIMHIHVVGVFYVYLSQNLKKVL